MSQQSNLPTGYTVAFEVTCPVNMISHPSPAEIQESIDAIANSALEALRERFPLAKIKRMTASDQVRIWVPPPD